MNKRTEKQIDAFLIDAPRVGGVKIYPLTPARLGILERRGNPLVSAGSGNQFDAMAEIFFVCATDKETLKGMRRMSPEDWADKVEDFSLDLPPHALGEFGALLQAEIAQMEAVSTVPGKPGPNPEMIPTTE